MDPTRHCLNCWKSMEGICKSYLQLQFRLFSDGSCLDERIDFYRGLCIDNGCYRDTEIFGGCG